MATSPGDIRILLCADTHLGFDEPIRPRVERRRRGADFFANFQRVLDEARTRRVDLVVHGGDLFFRSRVPGRIVDRVYAMLRAFAEGGIPILIVPGNHERSVLPTSLFLSHPNIHVFAEPETKLFDVAGTRIAFTGIPSVRGHVGRRFRSLLASTRWAESACDVRFLCLHQTVEGARVGPADFTFRAGEDVVSIADIPCEFDAVLAGHIHRRQVLKRPRPDGTSVPVVYPGSIERTSFAERLEPKGFYDVTIHAPPGEGAVDSGGAGDSAGAAGPAAAPGRPESALPKRRRLTLAFLELPTRPMHDLDLDPGLRTPASGSRCHRGDA